MAVALRAGGTTHYINSFATQDDNLLSSAPKSQYVMFKDKDGIIKRIVFLKKDPMSYIVFKGAYAGYYGIFDETTQPRFALYRDAQYGMFNSIVKPDIPAGTYTTSSFTTLLDSYLQSGGNRVIKNHARITVNGQSIDIYSGQLIHRVLKSSTPNSTSANWAFVGFKHSTCTLLACNSNGFALEGNYIIGSDSNKYFASYNNYPIKIDGIGLCFR